MINTSENYSEISGHCKHRETTRILSNGHNIVIMKQGKERSITIIDRNE